MLKGIILTHKSQASFPEIKFIQSGSFTANIFMKETQLNSNSIAPKAFRVEGGSFQCREIKVQSVNTINTFN